MSRPVQLRPWLVTAKTELADMRRMASVLPLAEELLRSKRLIDQTPVGLTRTTIDGSRYVVVAAKKTETDAACFFSILNDLTRDGTIRFDADRITLSIIDYLMSDGVRICMPTGNITVDKVAAYNRGIAGFRRDLSEKSRFTLGLVQSFGRTLQMPVTNVHKGTIGLSVHYAVVRALLQFLPTLLSISEADDLVRLAEFGVDRVAAFCKLNRKLSTRDSDSEEGRKLRFQSYLLACPEAHVQCVAQYEQPISSPRKSYGYVPLFDWSDRGWVEYVDTREPALPRSEKEDLKLVKENYPGLYNISNRLTTEEQELHAFKNMVKRLLKAGIPADFISLCLSNRIREEDQIIEAFILSLSREEKVGRTGPTSSVSRMPFRPVKPTEDFAETMVAKARGFRSKEAFLDSIRFSTQTEAHIKAAGLTVRDVVYGSCKGFNFGRGNGGGGVGNSHYQGPVIRAGIRRSCSINPDLLLDYLDSIGLLIRHGSSSKGRVKDEAMSLDPNPGNAIGKEIIDTLQREFRILRSGGSS